MTPNQIPETRLYENLKDAGFEHMGIEEFMQSVKDADSTRQTRILSEHRRKLLDSIHKYQKKLDCLDYLIYHLKNK